MDTQTEKCVLVIDGTLPLGLMQAQTLLVFHTMLLLLSV